MKFNHGGKSLPVRLRTVLMTGALALVGFSMSAQTAEKPVSKLQVELKDGSKEIFLLADKPVITFNGDNCVIDSNTLSASYNMGDILQAIFLDENTKADNITANTIMVDLSDPSMVEISGADPSTIVNVYSITGTIAASGAADENGHASINISDLQKGAVYIVSVNATNNFKLIKK